MWIFNAIANAVGKNFIGTPNYLFGLLFNRVQADGGVTEAQQCTINELTELQNENLLSSASLVVTPSSYKESKLYSLIPTNGNGDFTFTRATTATRVNSAGLVELVPYNLFTYSQDLSNTNWNKTSSTVVSNSTTAPDGTSTADTQTVSAQFGGVNQFISGVTIGSTYNISFWAKRLTGTNAYSVIDNSGGSGIFGTYTPTTEWIRYSFSFVAASTAITLFPAQDRNASGFGSIYIWGLQVNEGGLKDYQKTETRLNIPRLDYSLGGCPSLLLEPQRTNLALRSQEFDNATWSKGPNVTITGNTVVAPNGTLTADSINVTSTSAKYIFQDITYSGSYTFSIYAKYQSLQFIQLLISTDTTKFVNFDILNGLVTRQDNSVGTIENVGNGWFRCSISLIATSQTQVLLGIIGSGNATRVQSNSLVGTSYIWGAQLEQGSYATSYIPTTSASVTRNYDIPSLSNVYTNGFISASGGTWYSYLLNNVPRTRDSGGGVGLRLTNVAGNNLFHISTPSGANQRYWIRKIVGGTNTDLYNTITNEIKVAIKWNGTTADVFVNGVEVVSATAFTSVDLENLNVNNPNIPYSINAMTLFPTPLTDAECIALTTI